MSGESKVITLISDFGTTDGYVGAMKGVILSINPGATIIDISHHIDPQNIPHAAYVLDRTHRYFPKDSVHVTVVDPGVGTDRDALIMKTPEACFVAPDNGVLSYVADRLEEAVRISNPRYWIEPVSSTFHGRDVFAPVAAHLSLGRPIADFGERVSSLTTFERLAPDTREGGLLIGHVIHIDHFGNLITDVERTILARRPVSLKVGGHTISGISSSYAEGGPLVALIGSDDHLEIGLRNGNAAAFLGAQYGDEIEIRTGPAPEMQST